MAENISPLFSDVSLHSMNRLIFQGEAVSDNIVLDYNKLHLAVLDQNIESCLQIIEENCVDVNHGNAKGDTPLHIASRNECRSAVIYEILVNAGANVNAGNKWKQTPLHYAAIAQSLETIEILLNIPGIDVNAVDVNGYNALHIFIASNTGSTTFGPYSHIVTEVSQTCKKGLHLLIGAGISVNSQTKFGHGILHLAANRNDNAPLLQFIMANFPGIDLKLRNQMNETFLHIYAVSDVIEKVMNLFTELEKNNKHILKDLLNMSNIFGRTPWEIMIENGSIAEHVDTSKMVRGRSQTLKKILSYGVFINRADNLGNTMLHRIAGTSSGNINRDFLEVLIESGAELNAVNIFGESPASVLFLEPVFNLFMRHKMNFKTVDRWGRSLLVSVMKHRPLPSLVKKIIQEARMNVNERDIYNSTPLHFAAYHNFPEQIEILLKNDANEDCIDKLQDKPIDTVKRHCSFRCHKILHENDRRVQDVGIVHQSFEEILLDVPRLLKSSSLTSVREVHTMMNLPENMEDFIDYLLTTYFDREQTTAEEVQQITSAVSKLVESICKKLAGYDSRFKITVFPTGSSAEGTKVGRPDEFDFILCLGKLDEMCDIVITEKCLDTGYACLKFKNSPVDEDFVLFSDLDGYFLAFPFLQHFFRYLQRALNEAEIWATGNLYYSFEHKMVVINGKPVFNFDVYWNGSVYKQLKISIDLVPAVYKPGWWPPTICLQAISLMNQNDKIKAAGCFLILQTRSNEFDTEKDTLYDSIDFTCNGNESHQTLTKKRMLRISATPAEIFLMKSLPEKFRRAYALAKLVKMKDICPEIKIESLAPITKLCRPQETFRSEATGPTMPSKFIKSYMLKTCTFYAFEKMQSGNENLSEVSDITAKLFTDLYQYFKFAEQKIFKPYFLPYSDVFEFEKDKQKSSKNKLMLSINRELSIKLILGILNHPFPVKR